MKNLIKNNIPAAIISVVLVVGFVALFAVTFGGKAVVCFCGGEYKVPMVMPTHYHLRGEDWNSIPESPSSYFREEDGYFQFSGYGGDVKIPKTIDGKTVECVTFNGANWNVTGVYFPEGVTKIPESCFEYNEDDFKDMPFKDSRVAKVFIPGSVTEIGAKAFLNCKNLKAINIPNSVTKIGESAFAGCKSLTSIAIPAGVTEIGKGTFSNCENLTSISIPNSVTKIGENAFEGCTSLTSLTIPSRVAKFVADAFSNCENLKSIIISYGDTEIGANAFSGYKSLTSITIPDSVTKIGAGAFANCEKLESINLSNSITEIGTSAFSGCKVLTSITIPDSVIKVEIDAFNGLDLSTTFSYKGNTYDFAHINDLYKAIYG